MRNASMTVITIFKITLPEEITSGSVVFYQAHNHLVKAELNSLILNKLEEIYHESA